jgi:hypothetical protein
MITQPPGSIPFSAIFSIFTHKPLFLVILYMASFCASNSAVRLGTDSCTAVQKFIHLHTQSNSVVTSCLGLAKFVC